MTWALPPPASSATRPSRVRHSGPTARPQGAPACTPGQDPRRERGDKSAGWLDGARERARWGRLDPNLMSLYRQGWVPPRIQHGPRAAVRYDVDAGGPSSSRQGHAPFPGTVKAPNNTLTPTPSRSPPVGNLNDDRPPPHRHPQRRSAQGLGDGLRGLPDRADRPDLQVEDAPERVEV